MGSRWGAACRKELPGSGTNAQKHPSGQSAQNECPELFSHSSEDRGRDTKIWKSLTGSLPCAVLGESPDVDALSDEAVGAVAKRKRHAARMAALTGRVGAISAFACQRPNPPPTTKDPESNHRGEQTTFGPKPIPNLPSPRLPGEGRLLQVDREVLESLLGHLLRESRGIGVAVLRGKFDRRLGEQRRIVDDLLLARRVG